MGETAVQDCGIGGNDWTYDGDGQSSLTNALAEAIADHEGVEHMNLDFSLYSSVDAEALETLLDSVSETEVCVRFRVANVVVSLRSEADDEVSIGVADADQ
ncbi:HalOD1 output domain-containing protein [Halorussus caseinilyticus]|uniref:HalOD1 output domain-containing protein n=1 Tax=Halorussus caseinilyticus TaxID=3034025 RepID=UPI0023E8357F|nr:HalOD1 output domain-containing protein [Halorussus sp. DT72]